MLNECAPGHKIDLKTRNWFVFYNGLTFPSLPKYDEIEVGHTKKMARTPGILDCAKKFLKIKQPQLKLSHYRLHRYGGLTSFRAPE